MNTAFLALACLFSAMTMLLLMGTIIGLFTPLIGATLTVGGLIGTLVAACAVKVK